MAEMTAEQYEAWVASGGGVEPKRSVGRPREYAFEELKPGQSVRYAADRAPAVRAALAHFKRHGCAQYHYYTRVFNGKVIVYCE